MKAWPVITLIALIFLFNIFLFVAYAEEAQYEVYDHEPSIRLVMTDGTQLICLMTGEGNGFTGSKQWNGYTCSKITPTWQFCKGLVNQPIVECVPPGTRIQGNLAAPRNKPDVRLGFF